jgi:hypothetical protein
MDIETINNFLSTEEYKTTSVKFKESEEFKKFLVLLTKIPINTKYYNNNNKYNATYAQLYKRKQGNNLESNVKKMNILLNKLSNRNLDDILQQCNEIILECEEIVPKMIESIFIKCSSQHTLCKIYTDLLIKLPQKDIKKTIQEKVDLYMNKVLETNGTKISKDESYDEFCDRLKIKSMFHGYSLFLTELHNKKYISLDYINKIMDIVVERLQGVDKINNETLVLSLHAISMNIDVVDKLDAYIPLLQELVDNNTLEMKFQFQIQDILDRFDI